MSMGLFPSYTALTHKYLSFLLYSLWPPDKETQDPPPPPTSCVIWNQFAFLRIAIGLDTNITKNRLNMFREIPDFFKKYLKKFF